MNYDSTSHRLNDIIGSQNGLYNTNYTYDSNGNILTANNITLTYDVKNRLSSSASTMGTTTYHYNALGQRIRKQTKQGSLQETTWFVYDEMGRLISEQYIYGTNEPIVTDYIYMNDKMVAVARSLGNGYELYHVQTDHIGSPRSITKATYGSLVWVWENKEAFGATLPNENLGGINNGNGNNLSFKFNIRFMGHYWDEEKGTSYNYFRDYESGLGRYIQRTIF